MDFFVNLHLWKENTSREAEYSAGKNSVRAFKRLLHVWGLGMHFCPQSQGQRQQQLKASTLTIKNWGLIKIL